MKCKECKFSSPVDERDTTKGLWCSIGYGGRHKESECHSEENRRYMYREEGTDERCCGNCKKMLYEDHDGFGYCADGEWRCHCSQVCDDWVKLEKTEPAPAEEGQTEELPLLKVPHPEKIYLQIHDDGSNTLGFVITDSKEPGTEHILDPNAFDDETIQRLMYMLRELYTLFYRLQNKSNE